MKVSFVPNQPHCYAFGGFELQMLAAYHGLQKAGCDISLFDPWSRTAAFDIIHVWGLEISQYHNIVYSRKAKKKVVVTVLMSDLSTPYKRFRFFISGLIYKVKIMTELTRSIDAIVAVSEFEKNLIHKHFRFPRKRIAVIPHIVSTVYMNASPRANNLGVSDFVLCVGNICPRKNQLNLIIACNRAGFPILLMGNILPGEEAYADSVGMELGRNPGNKWIRDVSENSNDLITAYQHCRLFALLSHLENQPISVLEALVMKCKVLLANRPYACQTFYKDLAKADPDDVDDIQRKLIECDQKPVRIAANIEATREENVSRLYLDLYNDLFPEDELSNG